MARTLVRPSLYEEDFLAWTEQQAALLRAGRLDQLDLDKLAEELDTTGRSESGELESRLEVLLMPMLTWDHQPARRARSWKATMREQRNAIRRLMRRSPSLKRDLETTIAEVYPDAVGRAIDETGPSAATFPDRLPYGLAEILEAEPATRAVEPMGRAGRRRKFRKGSGTGGVRRQFVPGLMEALASFRPARVESGTLKATRSA